VTIVFGKLVTQLAEKDSSVYAKIADQLSVRGIFVLDSTSETLPEGAKKFFPGPRKNVAPASIKIHGLYSLTDNILHWMKFSPAKIHDRNFFPDLNLLIGYLIIFDLAYWDFTLFNELNRNGISFLSRVKKNSKITIVKIIRGLPKSCTGWGLFSEKASKYRENLIEVFCRFNLRGRGSIIFRVIGFWNSHEHKYFWYVTNLTCTAKVVYPLYRLRWAIELFWKENKSLLLLDQIKSSKPNTIRNLILVTMIASIVFGTLALSLLETEPDEVQVAGSIQRVALVFDYIDFELFSFLYSGSKRDLKKLLEQIELFKSDLYDPNFRNRKSSLADVSKILKICPRVKAVLQSQ